MTDWIFREPSPDWQFRLRRYAPQVVVTTPGGPDQGSTWVNTYVTNEYLYVEPPPEWLYRKRKYHYTPIANITVPAVDISVSGAVPVVDGRGSLAPRSTVNLNVTNYWLFTEPPPDWQYQLRTRAPGAVSGKAAPHKAADFFVVNSSLFTEPPPEWLYRKKRVHANPRALVTVPAVDIAVDPGAAPVVATGGSVTVPTAVDIAVLALAPGILTVVKPPAFVIAVAPVAPVIASGKVTDVPAIDIAVAPGTGPVISTGAFIDTPAVDIAVAPVAPAIVTGTVVSVPAVDIAVVPVAPTLSAVVYHPTAVDIAVAPVAPVVASGKTVVVPAIDIAVAAVAPDVEVLSHIVNVSAAANIDVAALAPQMAGQVYHPTPADISVTPIAPTLAAGVTILPPAVDVAVIGVAPDVATGKFIAVPAANIELDLYAPYFSVNLQVPAATITIVGYEPEVLTFGPTIETPTIFIDVVGLFPEVVSGKSINVLTTPELILQVYEPVVVIDEHIQVLVPAININVLAFSPTRAGFIGTGDLYTIPMIGVLSDDAEMIGVLDKRIT